MGKRRVTPCGRAGDGCAAGSRQDPAPKPHRQDKPRHSSGSARQELFRHGRNRTVTKGPLALPFPVGPRNLQRSDLIPTIAISPPRPTPRHRPAPARDTIGTLAACHGAKSLRTTAFARQEPRRSATSEEECGGSGWSMGTRQMNTKSVLTRYRIPQDRRNGILHA